VRRLTVEVEEGVPRGGLYALEQATYHKVVDSCSEEVLLTFEGRMEASLSTDTGIWEDAHYSGVYEVLIGPDERSVMVRYYDGREEVVPVLFGRPSRTA